MCGIVGIIGRPQAAMWISRGLYALQHRGHDSCGVAYLNSDHQIFVESGQGAVADVLPNPVTEKITSNVCIGQNLYTTVGDRHSPQPFGGRFWDQNGQIHQIALAHNGQLCGLEKLRRKYPTMYTSHSDSEVIFALLPHMPGTTILDKIKALVKELDGAFSLIIISEEGITAVRDSHGFRPLIMGHDKHGAIMFASEINAFDIMEGHFDRQVEPGEIVHVNHQLELTSQRFVEPRQQLDQCVFEHIYFARPDNQLFGKPGYSTQQMLGQQTALAFKDQLSDMDIVVPVPDSSTIASLGFSKTIGIPLEMGLLRHHFASRTFITKGQSNRERAVRLKFSIVKDVIQGKKIILADDSLVRSTTSKIIIEMLRKGGAKEIHMILFSPPITHSCIYGINTPTREELIAYIHNSDQNSIAKAIGADSVYYLPIQGLKQAMLPNELDYCYACMNGDYPISAE